MNTYDAYITVKTVHANIEAESKARVLEIVKEQFKQDFNLDLTNEEIKIERR